MYCLPVLCSIFKLKIIVICLNNVPIGIYIYLLLSYLTITYSITITYNQYHYI